MNYYQRYFTPPKKQSFFLFGPRGTGKSTLIRKTFPDALWVDLLKPDMLRTYSARPEHLFEVVRGAKDKKTIVIDEIQNVPSLLSVVHSLIEEKLDKQFILTGSSSRKLKRTGANLLGGRALHCSLHPFMAAELGDHFSLEKALQIGLLPLLLDAERPNETLAAYIGLYLKEEIQTESLVRNLESFSRFLEGISFSHASQLNITNVARECEVQRKTVDKYVGILEELLLAHRLSVFSKRAQRKLVEHPKFYLFDAGVYRILRQKGYIDRSEEIEGIALEGLVAQHLIAWNDYSMQKHDITFWRTRAGLEVDFVINGSHGFWAIEVKNSSKVFSHDCKSLEAFQEEYPKAKPILLYRGKDQLLIKNVLCMPVEDFLKQIKPNCPLS